MPVAASSNPVPKRRRWRRVTLILLTGLLAAGFGVTRLPPFGAAPEGNRLERIRESPHWSDGSFHNQQPQWIDIVGGLRDIAFTPTNADSRPVTPPAVAHPDSRFYQTPPASGLRVTWFGHSSTLLEIDGINVLIDPFWGERASPFDWLGPRRWFEAPIGIDALPSIDVVVISHDHYDHLDKATILKLKTGLSQFVVPLGMGAHLERWGVATYRIHELDWWQSFDAGMVRITATPARHASGRLTNASDRTLWAGYAIAGPMHRAWYSGDTGFHDAFAEIGQRLGPFDITLIDAGQYNDKWPDAHLGPEQALEAHRLVRGKEMIPVHWALFGLAPHTWTEPVERVLRRAQRTGDQVRVLRPGLPTELTSSSSDERWWPTLPTQTPRESPLTSTLNGDPSQRYPELD